MFNDEIVISSYASNFFCIKFHKGITLFVSSGAALFSKTAV